MQASGFWLCCQQFFSYKSTSYTFDGSHTSNTNPNLVIKILEGICNLSAIS